MALTPISPSVAMYLRLADYKSSGLVRNTNLTTYQIAFKSYFLLPRNGNSP